MLNRCTDISTTGQPGRHSGLDQTSRRFFKRKRTIHKRDVEWLFWDYRIYVISALQDGSALATGYFKGPTTFSNGETLWIGHDMEVDVITTCSVPRK